MGVRILAEALQQPIRLVIENKTGKSAALTIEKIENEGSIFVGFDAKNEKICDMVEEGIVDSQQVVQTYLQDAVTLSGMVLSTECLVVKEKNYEPLSLKYY